MFCTLLQSKILFAFLIGWLQYSRIIFVVSILLCKNFTKIKGDVIIKKRGGMMEGLQTYINNHQRYYRMLEEDFLKTARFVEICSANKETYSIEYLKQLQSICSEFEILLKYYCKLLVGDNNYKNLIDCERVLFREGEPELVFLSVAVEGMANEILPYEGWQHLNPNDRAAPFWWSNYNSLKHNRINSARGTTNFYKANLDSTLNALAALFILNEVVNKFLCQSENKPYYRNKANSKLFSNLHLESDGMIISDGLAIEYQE